MSAELRAEYEALIAQTAGAAAVMQDIAGSCPEHGALITDAECSGCAPVYNALQAYNKASQQLHYVQHRYQLAQLLERVRESGEHVVPERPPLWRRLLRRKAVQS